VWRVIVADAITQHCEKSLSQSAALILAKAFHILPKSLSNDFPPPAEDALRRLVTDRHRFPSPGDENPSKVPASN
jgi:hypothetical protein